MYLQKLTLHNFKNYDEANFAFSEKVNCFVGNNGVGKTNLLDAIHYLSFCKSYFSTIDSQNIRHESDFFSILGTCVRPGDISESIHCIQKRGQKKRFLVNKTEYERLSDHIGNVPLVMISPYDRDLINDGSEERRKYIDSVISQFDKLYLDDLICYNRALNQRNMLLRIFSEQHRFDQQALEVWDEQLIPLGTAIFRKRMAFLQDFIPIFRDYYEFLTACGEHVDIRYSSQLEQTSFRELLAGSLKKDQSVQFTTTGIHKDDLELLLNGYPIKRFGSQGQQKSFVIAIKLAQFDYTCKVKGYKPLLLLDDVFDKLDDLRVQQLIRMVSNDSFGQVFITDTQEEKVRRIFDAIAIEHRFFTLPEKKNP
jgi:DNA replication and repair protein RecF